MCVGEGKGGEGCSTNVYYSYNSGGIDTTVLVRSTMKKIKLGESGLIKSCVIGWWGVPTIAVVVIVGIIVECCGSHCVSVLID